jgi:hypothetical protein
MGSRRQGLNRSDGLFHRNANAIRATRKDCSQGEWAFPNGRGSIAKNLEIEVLAGRKVIEAIER